MIKKSLCLLFSLLFSTLISAQTPSSTPLPANIYSLLIGVSDSGFSAAVQVLPHNVYMSASSAPLFCSHGEEIRLILLPLPIPTPPPCGDAYYPVFSHWEIAPVPSYPVNLNNSELVLIMDQDYVVTPVVVNTVYHGPPCNRIEQYLSKREVTVGEEFSTNIVLSLSSRVAAYAFTITYDPQIITLDISKGNEGVAAGTDGFLSAFAAAHTPGEVRPSGFDLNGKGPGLLPFLTFYWRGGPGTGDSFINIKVDNLTDGNANPIYLTAYFPNPNKTVSVVDSALSGDVNNDGIVNIIDALVIARFVVGYPVVDMNTAVADVNRDNLINIVDALVIAQYVVGLIPGLPL